MENPLPYREALLLKLKYSRRFQECCYLIREAYPTLKRDPGEFSFVNFMIKRKDRFDSSHDLPQVRDSLRRGIRSACFINGMEDTQDNIYLVFACVVYGVQAAISRIMSYDTNPYMRLAFQERPTVNPRKAELEQIRDRIVIRYLRGLLEFGKTAVDICGEIDDYVEHVTCELNNSGWGHYCHNKKDPGYSEPVFDYKTKQELPERFRYIQYEIRKEPEYLIPEPAIIKNVKNAIWRNHAFWRMRRAGKSVRQIGEKWDKLHNDSAIADEDSVKKAIRRYEDKCGSLLTRSPVARLKELQTIHKDANRQEVAR